MFYPLIRVLPSHPCFTLSSVFYPLIRVLPSHPCFTLSSVFYPFIRVLPFHPCFTLLSVFYPLIRVLPSHPCFTLSSVFYPLIRVLPSHPSVRPSVRPLFTLSSVPRFTLTPHVSLSSLKGKIRGKHTGLTKQCTQSKIRESLKTMQIDFLCW